MKAASAQITPLRHFDRLHDDLKKTADCLFIVPLSNHSERLEVEVAVLPNVLKQSKKLSFYKHNQIRRWLPHTHHSQFNTISLHIPGWQ